VPKGSLKREGFTYATVTLHGSTNSQRGPEGPAEHVRSPVGALLGKFHEPVAPTLQGLIFDLKGGRFRVERLQLRHPEDVTTMAYRACFLRDRLPKTMSAIIRRWLRPEDA